MGTYSLATVAPSFIVRERERKREFEGFPELTLRNVSVIMDGTEEKSFNPDPQPHKSVRGEGMV